VTENLPLPWLSIDVPESQPVLFPEDWAVKRINNTTTDTFDGSVTCALIVTVFVSQEPQSNSLVERSMESKPVPCNIDGVEVNSEDASLVGVYEEIAPNGVGLSKGVVEDSTPIRVGVDVCVGGGATVAVLVGGGGSVGAEVSVAGASDGRLEIPQAIISIGKRKNSARIFMMRPLDSWKSARLTDRWQLSGYLYIVLKRPGAPGSRRLLQTDIRPRRF